MYRLQFVGNRRVQQVDAVRFFHTAASESIIAEFEALGSLGLVKK
jgi:hypothetical protein